MKKLITFLTLLTLFFTTAGARTVTDVLSYKTTGITGNSYADFSGKKATSDAVYAGNCAGSSNTIQLRNSSNSGVMTTASGGKVKKITVTWHNPASGDKLVFYGKNSAYSSTADIYNTSKQGTRLGYIEYGGSNSLTVEGDFEYLSFRPINNVVYLANVIIEWEVPLDSPTITLSPSAPYYDGDEVTANITTNEAGATIQYKLNDGEWTEYDSSNPPTFSTSTTIQAKTVLDGDESEVATETATFGPSCATVAEILALADDTQFKFRGNLVVSGKGGDSGKHLYAQDATGGIHFFDNMPDYATEDVIPAGFIAKKITYNGAVELTNLQNMSEATTTGELNAVELTPSQVTQNNPFIYALINNALIEQPGEFMTINVGGETVSLQETFPGVETPIVGKTYNIYGVTNWNNDARFMPLAYEEVMIDPGDGYYLVGNFNMESDGTTWVVKDARYKFTEENGTYTLNANLPNISGGVFFKVVHVDDNTNTWYGGEAGDYFGITGTVNSNIELKTGDAGKNFKLNIGGPTNFTINLNNNTLSLNVSREALLYYKGDNNSWELAPMTATDNGWTTSQEIAANGKFGFADEWGDHHGGSGWVIKSEHYNTDIPVTDNGDFIMETAGDYLLIVNNALSTLTVEASRNITCTAISDVPNAYDQETGYTYKAGGTIEAKVDGNTATKALPGEVVTLEATPWNGYTLHSITVKYSVTVDEEVTVIENELTPVNGVYSFEMPNADVEVTANFYAGGYPITVVSEHGTYNGPNFATVGETVEFNITDIEDGYRIIGVNATFTNNNGGTTSLTIKKNQNNSYSFGMPPFPVHVEVVYKHHSTAAGLWDLVTDASQLVDGNEYIIVYPDYYGNDHMTMSTTQNRNNRGATSIAFEDYFSVAGVTNDDTQVFKLEGDASGWYFKADGGYIYAASSNNNWLRTGVQKNDNAKAAITFEAGEDGIVYANIVFKGNNTRNDLRYNPNNGSPLFSCYASTSTLPKVSLYTRGEIITPNPPEFWPPSGELMPEDFYAEVWSEYEDRAIIYCLVDPGTAPTDPNTVKSEGARYDDGWGWGNVFVPGPGTHTIYAVAEVYGHLSEIASVTYDTYAMGDWKLVTNNRDLFVSMYEYIIVDDDYNKVVGAYDATNECFVALPRENNITFDPTYETATVNSDDVKIFSLEYEQGSGSWREGFLKGDDGYYYHAIGHVSNWDQNPPTPAIVRTQEPQNPEDLVWAYNGGHTGYVYLEHDNSNISYNTADGVFDCHNWNYPLDDHHTRIRLYYRAKPISLANLCQEGSLWQEYTISDELIAVACAEDNWGSVYLWCKDQATSINPTYNTNNYEDFMTVSGGFNGDWDQSNWIALRFNNGSDRNEPTNLYSTIQEYVGWKIKAETVKGVYANRYNYILDMSTSSLETNGRLEYPLNLYCPANFLQENLNGQATGHTTNTADKHYFFMNPKIQEVCSITFAVWNGTTFELPDVSSGNPANIPGIIDVYWDFNNMYAEDPTTGETHSLYDDLVVGTAYKFKAIVQRPEPMPKKAGYSSLKDGETGHTPGGYTSDGSYRVYPFDFDPGDQENIITNISIVSVGNAQVKSVKYVNVAGIVSDTPFDGVNIVVTEYTDGTRTTTKMLKK
ncbi:MAG: hypothetical protein IKW83_03380 [Muribaculaceae bacterium]|nr:hypothetical protein [Muribaculaceae bacterium]